MFYLSTCVARCWHRALAVAVCFLEHASLVKPTAAQIADYLGGGTLESRRGAAVRLLKRRPPQRARQGPGIGADNTRVHR